jgi:cytochrome c-type biogenesis protein
MALYLAGSQLLMRPGLYREFRFHPHLERFGPFAAPVTGAAFGLGWTPCIGPVLASVLAVASTQGDTARGAALLVAYSLGLGVPFLLVGLAFGKFAPALDFVKRHSRAITLISAAILAAYGLILLFDRLPLVTARLQEWLRAIGLERLVEIG